MTKFSIIVPVYNVENYLEECVNSILNQEFHDYEIILVNDGSTDKSGEICDEYAKKFENIKVIHQTNSGSSCARNTGINHAQGTFILFVDSDDFINKGSLSEISKCISEDPSVDVIFLRAMKFYKSSNTKILETGYDKRAIFQKPKEEVLKHLTTLDKFPGSASTKLVSRELIINNDLYFRQGLFSEDIDWTIRLLKAAQRFNYCDYPYYFYRQNRSGSITNSISIKNIESLLKIIKGHSVKSSQNDSVQHIINQFLAYEYVVLLANISNANLKKDKINEFIEEAKKYKWLLKTSNNKKVIATNIICNIFGLKFTSRLLSYYLKLR